MKSSHLPALLLLAGCVAACSTVRVTQDYDPEEDFAQFKTYAWLDTGESISGSPALESPLVDERIRAGIDSALGAKGLRKVGSSPDLLVTYHLSIKDKVRVSTTDHYYRTRGWTMSIPETQVDHYEEGTVVIDLADAKDQELVWRGIGRGRMRSQPGSPEQQKERAQSVAEEILAGYPPGGGR